MGPEKDKEIAGLVVAELRKAESFDWDHVFALWAIERAAREALTTQFGERPKYCWREREIAAYCYGLLYRKQPADIDWDTFQASLDDAIWKRDAADF